MQLIGVPNKAEKDQIVKSVMDLKNAEVEEGYTTEAVASRQDLLMDVKLLFEPEYAGDIKEKIPPKSTLRIPWAWLPGALCLLQEVREEKLVLDIGRAGLLYPDAKPHVHDVLLSMALAECAIAKTHFEKNKVSQGFEALARAQCLLRSKTSLGGLKLLTEIEESLKELAPACTLELLAMPQTPDNAECRRGAIAALRELLRQGLDVEGSRQISKARSICECLMAADGIDLKLEEAFCLFLLGQASEALERLRQVESSESSGIKNSVFGNEVKDAPAAKYSLNVLQDGFFRQKKRVNSKQVRGLSLATPRVNHRTISPSISSERLASLVSSQHLGLAVKQLTPTNMESPLQEAKPGTQSDTSTPLPNLKRDLGSYHRTAATSWMTQVGFVGFIAFVTTLGCIIFATKMLGRQSRRLNDSRLASQKMLYSSLGDRSGHNGMHHNFAAAMQQFLSNLRLGSKIHSNSSNRQKSSITAKRAMTHKEAEALVRQWQVIKAEALGSDHEINILIDILDEAMLFEVGLRHSCSFLRA
ncbi:Plastid division protein CDP1 chloroplastic [Bienertia sinuspersici]